MVRAQLWVSQNIFHIYCNIFESIGCCKLCYVRWMYVQPIFFCVREILYEIRRRLSTESSVCNENVNCIKWFIYCLLVRAVCSACAFAALLCCVCDSIHNVCILNEKYSFVDIHSDAPNIFVWRCSGKSNIAQHFWYRRDISAYILCMHSDWLPSNRSFRFVRIKSRHSLGYTVLMWMCCGVVIWDVEWEREKAKRAKQQQQQKNELFVIFSRLFFLWAVYLFFYHITF